MHPNIIKIKDSLNRPTCFILNKVNVWDAEKLIKKFKVDKVFGEDKIPPSLVKMASNFLSEPITDIINTAIGTNTFPDRAKGAPVTPIDKGKDDKHIYTNYRPVSVLDTFTKIIELAVFDQLIKHANHFLPIFYQSITKCRVHNTYL